MPFNVPPAEDFTFHPPGFSSHPSLQQSYEAWPTVHANTPFYSSLTSLSVPSLGFYSTTNCPEGKAVIFTNHSGFRHLYRKETNDQNETRYIRHSAFSKREESIRLVQSPRRVVAINALSLAAVTQLCLIDNYRAREAIMMYATATQAYESPCHCCSSNPQKIFPQCVAMPDRGHNIDEKCLNCHYLNCHCVWDGKDPNTPPEMRGALSQAQTLQLLTSPYLTSRLEILARTWKELVTNPAFQTLSQTFTRRAMQEPSFNSLQEFQVALLGVLNITYLANVSPTSVAELPTLAAVPLTIASNGEYGPDLSSASFPPAHYRGLIATASRTNSVQTFPTGLVPATVGSRESSPVSGSPASSRRGTISGGTPPMATGGQASSVPRRLSSGGLSRSPSGSLPRSPSGSLPRSSSGSLGQSPLGQEIPAAGSFDQGASTSGSDARGNNGGRGRADYRRGRGQQGGGRGDRG